eukprot:scaffold4875_cov155-Amphora_coffeaeformis.AAC.7
MNTTCRITTASAISAEAPQKSTNTEWSPFQIVSTKDSLKTQIKHQVDDKLSQRYGPYTVHSPISQQVSSLSPPKRIVYGNIKSTWQEEGATLHPHLPQPLSDELVWRVARFCNFDFTASLAMLKLMRPSHWNGVKAANLAKDYNLSQACTILPGLTTQAAQDFVYVYLARFTKKTCADPLRLLTYTMNACYDRYQDPAECKVALFINLQGYHISDDSSFQFNEWLALLKLLQGQQGPIKAARLLLVNAEAEFKQAWDTHLAKHCAEAFQWRLSFVSDEVELIKYLNPESEQYLPMDFPQGERPVKDLVKDFLEYRQDVEQVVEKHSCLAQTKELENTHPVDIALDEDFEDLFSDHAGVDLLFEASGHEPTSPKSPSASRRRASVESVATAKVGNTSPRRAVITIESPKRRDAVSGTSPQRNNGSPLRVTRCYKLGASELEKKDIDVDCFDRPPSPAKMSFTREASYRQATTLQALPDLPLSPTKSVSGKSKKSKSSKSSKRKSCSSITEGSAVSGSVVTTNSGESTASPDKCSRSPRKKKSSTRDSPQKSPKSMSGRHLSPDLSPSTNQSPRKSRSGNSGSTRKLNRSPTKNRHNQDTVAPASPSKGESSRKSSTSPSKNRYNRDIVLPASPRKNSLGRPGPPRKLTLSPIKHRCEDTVAPPYRKMTSSPSKSDMQSERSESSRKLPSPPTEKSTGCTPVSSPVKTIQEPGTPMIPKDSTVEQEEDYSPYSPSRATRERMMQLYRANEEEQQPATPKHQVIPKNSTTEQEETYSSYSPSRATRERMMQLYRVNEEQQQKCASPKKPPAKTATPFAGGCQGVRWQSLDDIQPIPDIQAPVHPSFEEPDTAMPRPTKSKSLRGLFRRFQSSPDMNSKGKSVASAEDTADKAVMEQSHVKPKSRRRLFNRNASVPVMDGGESSSHTSRTELSPSRVPQEAGPIKKRSSLRNLFRKALSLRTMKETEDGNKQPLPARRARRGLTLEVTQEE